MVAGGPATAAVPHYTDTSSVVLAVTLPQAAYLAHPLLSREPVGTVRFNNEMFEDEVSTRSHVCYIAVTMHNNRRCVCYTAGITAAVKLRVHPTVLHCCHS
jgi:hypothetical protein